VCPNLLNADNQDVHRIKQNMKTKYIAIVAVVAAMLVTTTAITGDSAFATKYKEKNQATSQVNNCGNEFVPIDVFCNNEASQVQGDENAPALAGAQGFDD
jgi:hypothetical protein